uniref:AGAP003001PA putative n=1 Tax=Albugo laibachii Nc14 TaxID=890382 RepID=F0WX98_9STRA|nr:AGAP003001PA putative [Albugo laibachii Nc14]|eukprot:CCA26090.1 AGAP003001PA putative [Albugo laibachii Nc14]
MTPTVMTSNSVVVGEDGATGVVLVDLDHGGSEFHVVDLEAGHTHWDTGIRSGLVCMAVDVISVSRGRVCISAKSIEASRITRLYWTIHMLISRQIRFLDDTKEEQLRGITMKSSVISLVYEAAKGIERESYLINLVDSPGHVDFSFDVSTAVRICDGALVLIDAVEGFCPQTHAVLRQAWIEGTRPCLVINKIDRLILELGLQPIEAYQRLKRIIEQGNAIVSSLIRSDVIARYDDEQDNFTDTEATRDKYLQETMTDEISALEEQLLFSPMRGNVLFSSAIDGWAFGIGFFANFYAQKSVIDTANKNVTNPIQIWRKTLWGDIYYNPKTKKVSTKAPHQTCHPMFVQYILKPIWKVYKTISAPITDEQSLKKIRDLAAQMGVLQDVNERDLKNTDRRTVIKSLMSKWLPLSQSVLKMVTRVLPNPILAQRGRFHKLCAGFSDRKLALRQEPSHSQGEAMDVVAGIKSCNASEDAPLVIYVCKMICVDARLLSNYKKLRDVNHASLFGIKNESVGNNGEARQEMDEQLVYVAMGRIFSGTLRQGQELYIMGPKYKGVDEKVSFDSLKSIPNAARVEVGKIVPYLVMGRELYHVEKVPAGNIVGILGLHDFILKTATLSTTLQCPRFTKMPFQTKPIVRVAVEPEDPRDFEKLECGLQRLYRSDPTVEVEIQESGEHVIVALGELHLDRCIKDLKERFAKVSVRVSEPLVPFRETVVDGEISSSQESVVFRELANSTIQGDEHYSLSTNSFNKEQAGILERAGTSQDIATGTISNGNVTLSIRVLPLPTRVAQFLEDNSATLKQILTPDMVGSEGGPPVSGIPPADFDTEDETTQKKSVLRAHLVQDLRRILDDSDTNQTFWCSIMMNRLWSCGPHHCGSNMLINNVSWYMNKRFAFDTEGCNELSQNDIIEPQDKFRQQFLEKLENSIITGFQVATIAGPLCEEQVWGAAFVIEDIFVSETTTSQEYEATSSANFGPLSGQIISTMKSTCRLAFMKKPVRLVEAMYTCSVQCQAEQLGKLYSVLSKRRGNVISEDLADKMSLVTIKAHLPVVESFGLATDIRTQTSGAASNPQLVFSHWTMLEMDPFFQPQTEEEREDLGERTYEMNYVRRYIEAIRKRKGLIRDEKVVVHAEKQRTLGRKK